MELWDLYDRERRPLGRTHVRGVPCPPGVYHLVVTIWTVNSSGSILLTLRDPAKESFPNTWENTGGSALAGETSRGASVRELLEETGIIAAEEELVLLGSQVARDSLYDHYLLHRDITLDELRMQPGETVGAKWVTLDELDAMRQDGSLAAPIGVQFEGIRETFEPLVYGK